MMARGQAREEPARVRTSGRPHRMINRQWKYWVPAIATGILISIFSTHSFGSDETSRIVIPVLKWLFPWASNHWLHAAHHLIRKLAHVTEFGLFSVTVFHGVRGSRRGWRLDWAIVTLLIAVAYASLDEWHQTFVPDRQASPRDVLIDTMGALLAQSLVWIYALLHRPATVEETEHK